MRPALGQPRAAAGAPRWERWRWALAGTGALALFGLASAFDLAERWQSLSRAWEGLEVDELPLVLLVLAAGVVGLALHRSRRTAAELARSRRREEELRRAAELEERLGQAQKSEALRIFAGGLAHDLANLLLAIEAFAARLGGSVSPERERSLAGIHDATRQGRDLIGKLKELAEPSPILAVPLDLGRHLESLRGLLASILPDGIRLELAAQAGLPPVAGEPSALTQILLNLVANARDAMPAGGAVRITTSRAGEDGTRIRVSDTGTGMDAETVARACDPFFTTKPLGVGSGLGLTMVRVLTTQLGGSLELTSQPGSGTQCDVYLNHWEGGGVHPGEHADAV